MSERVGLLGIDWGTHSSKWIWTVPGSKTSATRPPFKILWSDVSVDEKSGRLFLSADTPPVGPKKASNIKGRLLKNPDASFWVGPQKSVKLTLGELVTFSLWSLIGEAYQNLCDKEKHAPERLEIRLSLPNWST